MVEIPDRLQCLFAASIEHDDDVYRIEVPRAEIEQGGLTNGETYRVGVLSQTGSQMSTSSDGGSQQETAPADDSDQAPPVEEGALLSVEIETLGDQGDGIAKIDRGYVVIVPGAKPGDEVTVEIQNARENVAFAEIRRGERVD